MENVSHHTASVVKTQLSDTCSTRSCSQVTTRCCYRFRDIAVVHPTEISWIHERELLSIANWSALTQVHQGCSSLSVVNQASSVEFHREFPQSSKSAKSFSNRHIRSRDKRQQQVVGPWLTHLTRCLFGVVSMTRCGTESENVRFVLQINLRRAKLHNTQCSFRFHAS
jgi:hypothetical protein